LILINIRTTHFVYEELTEAYARDAAEVSGVDARPNIRRLREVIAMARRVTAAALFGALCFAVPGIALMSHDAAWAAETDQSKTAGGLTVYLGVVPAEIVKGPPTHILLSKGPHEYRISSKSPHDYQIVAAIFDAASGERVSNVVVTAEVSGLGLSGSKKQLEPMQIAGNATYGGFFDLPGSDLYTLKLTVERSGTNPAVLQFKYDHRR
jgi:hypothetical protein